MRGSEGKMILSRLRKLTSSTGVMVNSAFDKAVKQTGALVDGETAKTLKESAIAAARTSRQIAKNLGDLNSDGKVDIDDLKLAAQKAGIVWEKIDPDLKSAMLAGGMAGVGVNFIPFVGQALAVPAFAATTAYFFLVAKLTAIKRKE